jgi:outer membrane protein TolC
VERRDGETDVEHLGSALSETIRAAELAREALLLTESRYANGAGTQLDVIDALRESRELDIAVAAAEDALRRATLELLAARGQLPTPQQLDVHHH